MQNASDLWYVETSSQGVGPLTGDAVRQELANGTMTLDTLVCPIGGREWVPLRSVPQLAGPPAPLAQDTTDEFKEDEDYESPASVPFVPRRSRKKYGFLLWAANVIDALAAATALIGGAALIYLAATFASDPRDIPQQRVIASALSCGYLVLVVFTSWLSLRVWAWLIRLAVQLEYNSHQSAKWSRRAALALSTTESPK